MQSVANWLRAAVALVALSASGHAFGFCRATTCDPSEAECRQDKAGCFLDGLPVFWGSDCISVSVQADGAPDAGIDYAAARASVERALAAWSGVDCPGGGHPSIRAELTDPVECSDSEYNPDKRNANVVMFRDKTWPYAGQSQDVLGYTRINFSPDTGELYDVDVELNAVAEPLAVGRLPKSNEADLDSIVTHEIGHLLGLNHSLDVEATMVGGYQNGSYELRTPASDDIAGICAIYPPDRMPMSVSCDPRHGFSSLCGAAQPAMPPVDPTTDGTGDIDKQSRGCAMPPAPPSSPGAAPLAVLGLALFRHRRRLASAGR